MKCRKIRRNSLFGAMALVLSTVLSMAIVVDSNYFLTERDDRASENAVFINIDKYNKIPIKKTKIKSITDRDYKTYSTDDSSFLLDAKYDQNRLETVEIKEYMNGWDPKNDCPTTPLGMYLKFDRTDNSAGDRVLFSDEYRLQLSNEIEQAFYHPGLNYNNKTWRFRLKIRPVDMVYVSIRILNANAKEKEIRADVKWKLLGNAYTTITLFSSMLCIIQEIPSIVTNANKIYATP